MVHAMNNPNLGILLRYYRKSANLSVNDVVAIFQKEYNTPMSNKTIYSWETSKNQPSADTLLTLCRIYNITNIVEALGYSTGIEKRPLNLTDKERELIMKYRSNDYFHKAVDQLYEIN